MSSPSKSSNTDDDESSKHSEDEVDHEPEDQHEHDALEPAESQNGDPSHVTSNKDGNGHADVTTADDVEKVAQAEDDDEHIQEKLAGDHTDDDEDHEGEEGPQEEEEEDDDEEEDEDDEDEEEEDEEPALKYERIAGSVPDLFKKDSASALTVAGKQMILGTHDGRIWVMDLLGNRIKFYKSHLASIVDIVTDESHDFIASASIDGKVVIHSMSTPEAYSFDMKRPMRTVALEPQFAKRSTRSFVCGGMSGSLVLHEKGWLGHKETVLHAGEGPIWTVRWRGRLIAWANDLGVKIYDTLSQTRITYIDRPPSSPRADLFLPTLLWQDDSTLLIAWADHIKVARIRLRQRNPAQANAAQTANQPPLVVEITAVFQLDCMIAGVAPHPTPGQGAGHSRNASVATQGTAHSRAPSAGSTFPALTSLLVLAYSAPDQYTQEATEDRKQQARKLAEMPELRIISRAGEELTSDALSISGYERWGCNDYALAEVGEADHGAEGGRSYVVLSPRDVVLVKPRTRRDRVEWLVRRERYEEALEVLEEVEREEEAGGVSAAVATTTTTTAIEGQEEQEKPLTAAEVGRRYIEHLISQSEFSKAARLCPKVCSHSPQKWEEWVFVFAQKQQLEHIIPLVPIDNPRLSPIVYNLMLAWFLAHDRPMLRRKLKEWPKEIYDLPAVIVAVVDELERIPSTSASAEPPTPTSPAPDSETALLMECLADLYTLNRQPGKALPYFLRLKKPNVFDLIREYNLFADVKDQALLLVEFDLELMEKRREKGKEMDDKESRAITLLVDHSHSIPIPRVVDQLNPRSSYLFLYLDALFSKDPTLVTPYSDTLVTLYASHSPSRLLNYLRASTEYNLESAYAVCSSRDLVPEMVFLLGRMGNNKQALTLIIERLGDVDRAIDFAREQNDYDLWEDLLRYSESRPSFIRGLLERVGADSIDPVRLIRRIKNGLEIPGLQDALVKILQDFQLQISLMEGCGRVMEGDCAGLERGLEGSQTASRKCPVCTLPLLETPQSLLLLFFCRHTVHARCVAGGEEIPPPEPAIAFNTTFSGGVGAKIAFASVVRAKLTMGCPVCHKRSEGQWR